MFIAIAISGLANAAILAIINAAAQTASYDTLNFRYLLMFVVVISLYIFCLRYTMEKTVVIFEDVLKSVRDRIADKIRHSDLIVLDHIGESEIYNRLTQETAVISESEGLLVAALQAAIMVLFIVFYIAFLSILAFIITLVLVAGGVAIYLQKEQETTRFIHLTSQKEIEFVHSVTHILSGFKELKVHRRRSDDLLEETKEISQSVRDLKIETAKLYTGDHIFSQCFFYVLMGVIVFLLPRLSETYTDVIMQTTAAILFIIGPLTTVVSAIPRFARVNIAVENIYNLEQRLDEYQTGGDSYDQGGMDGSFKEIIFDEVEFSYLDRENNRLFSVGPCSLTVRSGEILFITGGNGSGKSTVLKLLTALYHPDRGTIRVDNVTVGRNIAQSYRELFSTIFADFHLFEKLYGLRDVSEDTVKEILKLMGLDNKTGLVGGRFTTLDLSTGQRKRLALLVTLLEDRPIYIFDEWSADQDPEFRAYFYDVLLQDLKKRGKTVVAVTHDERYHHVADRIIKMDYGKIESETTP